jgi:AraC family transcriptional regulator
MHMTNEKAIAAPDLRYDPQSATRIEEERQWRSRPLGAAANPPTPKVLATRWRGFDTAVRQVCSETPTDCYIIGISLRSMNVRVSISGRSALTGVAMPGTLLVTAPGVAADCIFRGPFDALHLHVPTDFVDEWDHEIPGTASLRSEVTPAPDATIERLGQSLLGTEDLGDSFDQLYMDGISTAIIARLLAKSAPTIQSERRNANQLVRWRLKRATEYIEAHLADSISLGDVAASTGLTRMHFAAQFRAATGLRPHQYLLRRRIERAQQLLIETGMPIVDVALSVGFQTQAHFTCVFSRFVGESPSAWRRLQIDRRGHAGQPALSNIISHKFGPTAKSPLL